MGRNRFSANAGERLTDEQYANMELLNNEFLKETAETRKQLWSKQDELQDVLESDTPDTTKANELQTEINMLRNEMSEKRLAFQLEAKKIVPNVESFGGRGKHRGYGQGNHSGRR